MWTNDYIIILISWHLHQLIYILTQCRPHQAESSHWHRPRPCWAKPLSSAHESSGKASTSRPTHASSDRTSTSIQIHGSWSYRSELLHSHPTRPHRADLPHPHQPKAHQAEPLPLMILIRPDLICLSKSWQIYIHRARSCWAVFRTYDAGGWCSPDAGTEHSRSRQFRIIISRWYLLISRWSRPEIVIGKCSKGNEWTQGLRRSSWRINWWQTPPARTYFLPAFIFHTYQCSTTE